MKKTHITLNLDAQLWEQVKSSAQENGQTLSGLVEVALKRYLAQEDVKEEK